jgi:outer membrane biosynthesis protein TonB
LHEAIYAALKYPAQTAYHAATGLTTVEYDYLNGHATNIHVTDPSGDSLLDRVAAAAVNGAKYPLPGPELVDKTIHDTVFVIFDNTGQLRRGSGYHLVDSSQDKTSAKPQDSRCAGN